MLEIATEVFFAGIRPVLALFKDRATAAVLCLSIVAAWLLFASWLQLGVIRPKRRQIGKVADLLSRAKDASRGLPHFLAAAREAKKTPWLANVWREFDETTIKHEDRELVCLTVRPEEYFNRQGCGPHLGFWNALPNYFVGVGLLFTFLGLVAALEAASGAVTAEIDAAQAALGQLFTTATIKFLTSVFGLGASIAFSILVNRSAKRVDDSYDALCLALERMTELRTIEGLADQQLEELVKQRAELEKFNSDLGMQIVNGLASKLDASFAERLEGAFGPLRESIDRLGDRLGNQSMEALGELAEIFRERLSAGAGAELNAMTDALGVMRGALDASTAGLGQQVVTMAAVMDRKAAEMATRLDGALRQFGDNAARASGEISDGVRQASDAAAEGLRQAGAGLNEELARTAEQLRRAVEPLEGGIRTFSQSVTRLHDDLDGHSAALGRSADQARAMALSMADAAREMQGAGTPLAEAAQSLNLTSRQSVQALDGLQAMQATGEALAGRLAGIAAELDRAWTSYADRFEQVDGRLGEVFGTFVEGTRGYQETVAGFVSGLDQSLDKAVRSLAATIHELHESQDDLKEQLALLKQSLEPVVPQAAE